ncbi:MAG: hypothetical protein IKB12_01225 [Clostridia bacterium]|nr:hypothetical protein [Clostridia bacterium]
MKTMKKILSALLVVVMCLTSAPLSGFELTAEAADYKVGDIIQFGSYPQSKVTDSATITALNNKAPAWENWTSYGYYTGTGSYGTMKQGDWMRYTDIMYNGNKYRGVKFTQYRPSYTYGSSSNNKYQYDNGYITNTVYWFKFEPIDWRVLDPATGLVMCETIIDSQPYSNTIYYNSGASDSIYAYFNDSSYKNYASDYETSSIRQWLNNDFYHTAFTDSEKKEINTTTLNNDGHYTSVGTTGYEKLDSNSTNDKIFLLSYNEVRNSNYGFNSSATATDTARRAQGSDYAQSQGLYVYRSSDSTYNNNSYWLLRSPGCLSNFCCFVYDFGYSYYYLYCDVYDTRNGVRPALRFNRISDIGQSEHQHSYTSEITTEATHTTVGVKTYTCECGDTYTEEIAKTEGHTYISAVTKEPTHLEEGIKTYTCECTHSYTESIPKLTEHTYVGTVTAPTCTTQGYTTYTCECGDSYVDDIVEARHTFSDEWTIDEDPTCKYEGLKSRHCEFCPARTDFAPIGKLTHDFVSVRVEPSCLDEGYIMSLCTNCGEEIIETIEPTGHDFDGSKCTVCDYDKADDCNCNCHKNGIPGLFWKIINFFNKLFKSKQYCSCGAKHW